MPGKYTLGLDFGTSSVRALIADAATGEEVATSVWDYRHGEAGVIVDEKDPFLARQDPADYVTGTAAVVRQTLREAAGRADFSPRDIIGIGVDTTGSTPLPVDAKGEPLAFQARFKRNPNAAAWLWKDHTGYDEAEEITGAAARLRPHYLAKCGGKYSSEWFWSKLLHCLQVAPEVVQAAHTWVEVADWIPAMLTGRTRPDAMKRGICAAGHKAMFNPAWGGYPDEEFVAALDPRLVRLRRTLPGRAYNVADAAGSLTRDWARRLRLPRPRARPHLPVEPARTTSPPTKWTGTTRPATRTT
jgi:L-ribulokinase